MEQKKSLFFCNSWRKGGIKAGTYEDAERRRAGWKGCEKLQNAEALFSQVQVIVSGALLTAELLQSPLLHTIHCMLHQRSQKCLTEGQKVTVKSPDCSAAPSQVSESAGVTFSILTCTNKHLKY